MVWVVIVSFAKTMKMMNRTSSHYGLHFGKGNACEKGDKSVLKVYKISNEYRMNIQNRNFLLKTKSEKNKI